MLGLLLLKLFSIGDPPRNELRELIGWNGADGVEVEVAAILSRRRRVVLAANPPASVWDNGHRGFVPTSGK